MSPKDPISAVFDGVVNRDVIAKGRRKVARLEPGAGNHDQAGLRGVDLQGAERHREHLNMRAMNEALLLGSLRQHELAEAAEKLTEKLRAEITGRQRVESELNKAMAVAEKANLAKSDFLSRMSHELRTPLNAILGFAQLMESGSPAPTISQKGKIDRIVKAGWYLLELINEILDLAAIETGKMSLSMEPVSLAAVMYECQVMVEPQAQKRGISMAFSQFACRYFVIADRIRVKQVLINLLSNAIKYNKMGGTVAMQCTLSTPDSIRVSVRDNGAGLAPEQLADLFQPFNRLGKETGVEEGTGIGLVVSKRLVDLMGGHLGVESTLGVGSVFWFELNLTAEPHLAAGAATKE